MNAAPRRWRRLAAQLARHAAWVLPGAASPWGDAMRRELDYIGDGPAAVRWALGCLVASYRVRLTHRPWFNAWAVWRYAAASGALLLVIGLALQDGAGGTTEPPRPPFDQMTCAPPDARANAVEHPVRAPEPSCAELALPDPPPPATPDFPRGR